MTRPRALVGGVLALLMLTSCGGGEGELAPGKVLEGGSGKVLVNAEQPEGVMDAGEGFDGRVELVGDCLGIGGNTIIWPPGTEIVSDNPLVVEVPGLGQVTIGDQVTGGADHYVDYLPEGIDAIPSGCPTGSVFAYDPTG